ncbi:hypothetical protein V5O48_006690 [Marasmius crinis-equi]|uniref:FMN hydroxy acid dehydrogenase domain-containing protein n=1 Tax=Marasmius crinis-equi TaxID=585013 RepID=A0ABR3FJ16_9AGAR
MEGLPNTGLDTTDWVAGELPPLEDMLSLNDFQIAAKNRLSRSSYAYYRTGALDEVTYQANLDIWKKVRIPGRSFRDVSNAELSTTILGHNFSLPFFIAPAARAGRANESAELSLVRAAGRKGVLYVPSISSTKSLEEIAAAQFDNQTLFHQEYIWSNASRVRDELSRMESLGYKAVFLTVDNTGINGIRTRNMRESDSQGETGHSATFDLQSLAQFQQMTSLPIVPKGIRTAADALACLQLGFPAIYVSNHGGRTLDGAPTAVETLMDIRMHAPEVFDRMEVYADGGVRRGNHVITLLALGAKAVGLGRTPMYANIWGEDGVLRMIDLLETELRTTMLLMGESNVNNINSSFINTKLIEHEFFNLD